MWTDDTLKGILLVTDGVFEVYEKLKDQSHSVQYAGLRHFAGLPPPSQDSSGHNRHPLCTPGELDLMMEERVKRITEQSHDGPHCVGSGAYVTESVMVTARHCVIDGDGIFQAVTVDGLPVQFLIASPYDDLALLRVQGGLCQNPFQLAPLAGTFLGKQIALIGFPLAWDLELDTGEAQYPYVGNGQISAFDGSRRGVGSYGGDFPNASGAAVVARSDVLQGIHIAGLWHEDTSEGEKHANATKIPREYEYDVNALWKSDPSPPVPAPSGGGMEQELEKVKTSLEDVSIDNKYLNSQVPHKGSSGIFAMATSIGDLMKAAELLDDGPIFQAVVGAQRLHRKRQKT